MLRVLCIWVVTCFLVGVGFAGTAVSEELSPGQDLAEQLVSKGVDVDRAQLLAEKLGVEVRDMAGTIEGPADVEQLLALLERRRANRASVKDVVREWRDRRIGLRGEVRREEARTRAQERADSARESAPASRPELARRPELPQRPEIPDRPGR